MVAKDGTVTHKELHNAMAAAAHAIKEVRGGLEQLVESANVALGTGPALIERYGGDWIGMLETITRECDLLRSRALGACITMGAQLYLGADGGTDEDDGAGEEV